MAVELPLYLFSHNRKVANIYKKYLRYLEGLYFHRHDYRYAAVLARAEFNCIYYEKDMRISKAMLNHKEKELAKFVIPPIIFPEAPEGVAYNREMLHQDWCLDFWHPLEKAMYPEYFARRELRKQQFLEMWERTHGPPKPEGH